MEGEQRAKIRAPSRVLEIVGGNLAAERARRRLTRQDLGRLAGLGVHAVQSVEEGLASPLLSTLEAFAAALQIPVSKLFEGA